MPKIEVVNTDCSYDYSHTCDMIVFKINRTIIIITMQHNFVCVTQIRLNYVTIDKYRNIFTDNTSFTLHSIVTWNIDADSDMITCVPFEGVTSNFPTRKSVLSEIKLVEREGRSCEQQ